MTFATLANTKPLTRFARLGSTLVLMASFSSVALAYDPNNPLGLSSGMNLVAFDHFDAPSSDVEGRVAVGGNMAISSYSINTKGFGATYAGNGLTVQGNLSFGNGTIWGNTVVGGNLSLASGASFSGNVTVGGNLLANNNWFTAGSVAVEGAAYGVNPYQTPAPTQTTTGSTQLGFDFASERSRMTGLTQTFDALSNSGSIGNDWGTLALNANNASLAVFDVNSTDMAQNIRLDNLSANTTVVINVHGQTVNFGSHGYDNFQTGRVLFNLPEATQVTFAAGVTASILAPLASFSATSGVINGQVVVANWSGTAQVNDLSFHGNIPAVPEPTTCAMWLLGLATLAKTATGRRART